MRGNQNGVSVLRKAAELRRVQFTSDMLEELHRGYIVGRSVDYLAEHLGVSVGVLRKKMRALNLPVGRWVERRKLSCGT
jgi:hypothetical protein